MLIQHEAKIFHTLSALIVIIFLMIFLFDGNGQYEPPLPLTSGFAIVTGPFVDGLLYPGYTLLVVLTLVDIIGTFNDDLILIGH